MNDLQIFSNPEFGKIRTLDIDGEPYFVGKDVATILGYAKPLDALSRHVDEEDSVIHGVVDNRGCTQQTKLINESGLYSLIILSTLPSARKFKKWITSEVIPSIRKTGGYGVPQMSQSELILKIAQNNVELERRIAQAEKQTEAVSEKLDSALDIFTQPVTENWKEETNRIINRMIEEHNLNYGVFRRKMYDELECIAKCDLSSRQTKLRKRMERAGATYKERQEISKIDIISRDDKLKAIFDGIVKKYMAKYALKEKARKY